MAQDIPCACVPESCNPLPYDSRKIAKLSTLAQLARKIKKFYYSKQEIDCMLSKTTLYWEPFKENQRL